MESAPLPYMVLSYIALYRQSYDICRMMGMSQSSTCFASWLPQEEMLRMYVEGICNFT